MRERHNNPFIAMLPSTIFSSIQVLVIGDVMLDRYWLGSVQRISPEAPVPVVGVEKTELRLGGAGNVAANVRGLGAICHLVSVIGDDEPGRSLDQILGEHGVNRHLHIDTASQTTEKLRIISRNQQLLRVDFEDTPRKEVIDRCLSDYEELLSKADVVVISDYGKGSLQNAEWMIQLAKRQGIPVVVDPKGRDFSRYRGATVVTPNELELQEVVGPWSSSSEMMDKALDLVRQIEIDGLLVTRGEDGMILFRLKGEMLQEEARSLEVYDISGAGDTVVAMVAAGVAAGLEWRQILRFSNIAAGVVVRKLGTAVATLTEIQAELSEESLT
jgi:rfaE bifunctional protein kinase chain/domain